MKPKSGRPPIAGQRMERVSMVRLSDEDYAAFELEAEMLSRVTGVCVTVSAYLRMAGRAMLGKKINL